MAEKRDSGDAQFADATDDSATVAAVGIKIPPFWPERPNVWFLQLEGQFVLSNITSDTTKYYHVVSNLDQKYIAEVEDIITNPPLTGKYSKLKEELISRVSASREQQVRQLLSNEELGDRKPSQFLRHLRHLAGAGVPDDFLKSLWSSRLPPYIQAIIASQPMLPLDDVAQLSDKIFEVTPINNNPQVYATKTPLSPSTTATMQDLSARIDELTRQVAALTSHQQRSRPTSRSRFDRRRWHSRSRDTSRDREIICWYHRKYADKASRCRAPCKYSTKNVEAGGH